MIITAEKTITTLKVSRILPHLCGLPKRLRGKRILVSLKAFFDESGLDARKDKALIIGGFLASVDEWERASDAWDECLHESPAVNYFSSRKSSETKTNNLARVIAQFDLQGFCASLPHRYFSNRDPKASRKIMGTRIYDWGFLTAVYGVLQYAEMAHPEEKVDFVFDKRTELRACINIYDEMKESGIERMAHAGECIPGDDKDLMPLQMADLLAGEFLSQANGHKPSEAWKIIAGAHPVAHLPGYLPLESQLVLESQKLARGVQELAADILKRFYRNKERSIEIAHDTAELVRRKESFDEQFKRLQALFDSDPEYGELVARGGKFAPIKKAKRSGKS
jgi:hypothetical protein